MSTEAVEWVKVHSGAEGTRLAVLLAIARLEDGRASIEALAEAAGVSHRTVHNCLPELEARGLIEKEQGGGRTRQNRYRIVTGETVQTVQTVQAENGANGANPPSETVQTVQSEPSETVQTVQTAPGNGANGATETVQTVQTVQAENGANGANVGGKGGESPDTSSPTSEATNSDEATGGGAGGTKGGKGAKGASRKLKGNGLNLGPLVDAFRALGLDDPVFIGGEGRAAQSILNGPYTPEDVARCWKDFLTRAYPYATDFAVSDLSFAFLLVRNRIGNWKRWDQAGRQPRQTLNGKETSNVSTSSDRAALDRFGRKGNDRG